MYKRLTRRQLLRGISTAVFAAPLSDARDVSAANSDPTERQRETRVLARATAQFNALKPRGLPGALIGIRTGNAPARTLALGTANVETRAPMTTDMTMRLGSIVKLFVGTVALQLVDEKKLSLDQRLSTFRPEFPNANKITLAMLGNHKSGIFNPLRDPKFRAAINAEPARELTRDEVMEVAVRNADRFTTIGEFAYSNANTVLLAEAAEKTTGRTISELIKARILEPNGVESMAIPTSKALAEPYPRGYRFGEGKGTIEYGSVFFDATDFSASWAGAAGNLNGTLEALLAVGHGLARGGSLSDKSRSIQRAMHPVSSTFGYGFCLAQYDGALGHAGDVPGFSSFLAWEQASDTLCVALCNLSNLKDKSSPATTIGRAMTKSART